IRLRSRCPAQGGSGALPGLHSNAGQQCYPADRAAYGGAFLVGRHGAALSVDARSEANVEIVHDILTRCRSSARPGSMARAARPPTASEGPTIPASDGVARTAGGTGARCTIGFATAEQESVRHTGATP